MPYDQRGVTVAPMCGTAQPLHGLACLVLAHDNARQVALLLEWLERHGARCYVHVDARAGHTLTELVTLASQGSWVLSAEESHRVEWGGFSIVSATLALMRVALQDAPGTRAMLLLSGTHLPIRDAAAIGARLLDGREHIDLAFAASEAMDEKSLRRFWYRSLPGREEHRPMLRWLNRNNWRLGRRDLARGLHGMTPMAGSQWWCISADCVRHILAFLEANAWYERFFRYSCIPDESFFHTLIGASAFAANHAPSPLYQMKNGYSPRVLTVADIPAAAASGMPFARKFDTRVDADAVRMALEMADGRCPSLMAALA
ncbi:beta-1,6-N-acetylglucosaminyltransferase [Falsiroseomonas sp.]|uniref:beta-1,6-N-acetylglucosaminyltransferase n=1 Tax=Falsiroseomonas sp. TaxID=2870721 RepID=UPI003566B9A2